MDKLPYVPPAARGTESPLEIPRVGHTLVVLGRALRLRCPHCGRGKVMAGWRDARERCAACGLRFSRGDAEYYSAGVMLANIVIAEGIFAIGFVAVLIATWPNVPWDALTWGAVVLMLALPVVLYPFSKVLWLAGDVLIRPVTSDDFGENER